MPLPIALPVDPMLDKAAAAVPAPDTIPGNFAYEPKWDGFRCLVFRNGDDVELGSRGRRFRHTAGFLRWRPDRDPESCTIDQVDRAIAYDLAAVLDD